MKKLLRKILGIPEPHTCTFTNKVEYVQGFKFIKCDHPGCNTYHDPTLDDQIDKTQKLIERARTLYQH